MRNSGRRVPTSPEHHPPATPSPACELLSRREQDGVIMTATRLAGCNGADWTRHVWWVRGRCVIVADQVEFKAAGDYVVFCTWRSPPPARLPGRVGPAGRGGS